MVADGDRIHVPNDVALCLLETRCGAAIVLELCFTAVVVFVVIGAGQIPENNSFAHGGKLRYKAWNFLLRVGHWSRHDWWQHASRNVSGGWMSPAIVLGTSAFQKFFTRAHAVRSTSPTGRFRQVVICRHTQCPAILAPPVDADPLGLSCCPESSRRRQKRSRLIGGPHPWCGCLEGSHTATIVKLGRWP